MCQLFLKASGKARQTRWWLRIRKWMSRSQCKVMLNHTVPYCIWLNSLKLFLWQYRKRLIYFVTSFFDTHFGIDINYLFCIIMGYNKIYQDLCSMKKKINDSKNWNTSSFTHIYSHSYFVSLVCCFISSVPYLRSYIHIHLRVVEIV